MNTKSPSILKRLISTFASSSIVLVVQLIILLSRSNAFDKSQQGLTALFVLNIDLIAHLSMLVGGSALVYLSSRHTIKALIIPSYIWAFCASWIGFGILYALDQVHHSYTWMVYLAGLLQALYTANHQIILGRNNLNWFNALQIVQNVSLMIALIYFLYADSAAYEDFLFAYLISIFLVFVLSLYALKKHVNDTVIPEGSVIKALYKLGFVVLIGGLAQRINNRLMFYILNTSFVLGSALVGFLATAISIVEKLMIISRSLSSVQYAEISAKRNPEQAIILTIQFLKLSTYLTLFGAIILWLIPENFFLNIIGWQWLDIKRLMNLLLPSIVLLTISNIFSHYFSGLGRYKINTYASLIGLLITVCLGSILIPKYSINGCIITISVSYAISTIFQVVVFYKTTPFSWNHWVLNKRDLKMLQSKLFNR